MSGRRSFAEDTALSSILEVLGRIARLVGVVVLARMLGAEHFGVISSLLAYAGLLVVVTDLGINHYITTVGFDVVSSAERNSIVTLKSFMMLLYFGLLALAATGVPGYQQVVFWILGGSVALSSVLDSFFAYLRAVHKFALEGWLRFSSSLTFLIIVLLLLMPLRSERALMAAAAIYIASALVPLLLALVRLRFGSIKTLLAGKFEGGQVQLLLTSILPLSVASIFGVIYNSIDLAMLGWFGLYEEAGIYGVAVRAAGLAALFGAVLVRNTLPLLSRMGTDITARRGRLLVLQSFLTLALIAVPILLVAKALSVPLFQLVFGETFAPTSTVFVVLVAGVAVNWFVLQRMFFSIALQQRWQVAMISVLAAIFNVAGNYWLIPIMGAPAAALTTLASYFIMLMLYGALQKQLFGLSKLITNRQGRLLLRAVFLTACLGVGLSIWGTPQTFWALAGQAAFVVAISIPYVRTILIPLWAHGE